MIDIMYMVGDSVWREPTKQLFTMHVRQKDEEGKDIDMNVIAVVKEDGMVNVFHKEGESMEDANSVIINSVNECDLRGHKLFAVHTLKEFMERRTISVDGKEAVRMENDKEGGLVQPMPTPKELPKEDEENTDGLDTFNDKENDNSDTVEDSEEVKE